MPVSRVWRVIGCTGMAGKVLEIFVAPDPEAPRGAIPAEG
jgi:hypothetical protein